MIRLSAWLVSGYTAGVTFRRHCHPPSGHAVQRTTQAQRSKSAVIMMA